MRASQSCTGLSTELKWSGQVFRGYSPVGVRNEMESSIAEAGTVCITSLLFQLRPAGLEI